MCGSSVAGLLRTRAQHTVEWHMTTRCGLHRPGRHSRLPKRRGRGQPDACFLAVGITPLASADHLIAWRIPCAPGRITLIGRYAWRNASMSGCRIGCLRMHACAHVQRHAWTARHAQARHATRGPFGGHHFVRARLGRACHEGPVGHTTPGDCTRVSWPGYGQGALAPHERELGSANE